MGPLPRFAGSFPVPFLAAALLVGCAFAGPAFGDAEESTAEPPRALPTNAAPLYPRLGTGKPATVTLRVLVDDAGRVRDPEIVDGEEPFASAAMEAVRRWRYEPAHRAGRPVAVPWRIRVRFETPPRAPDRWEVYRREARSRPRSTASLR